MGTAARARGSVQEPVRLELGGDLLDGLLDVRGLAGPGADDLAAAEHQEDDLRLVDAVDEAGELFRLVLGATEGEGDRLEVELAPEGSRRDDVLDPEFGHGYLRGRRCVNRRGRTHPDTIGALYASVRPGLGMSVGRAPRFRPVPAEKASRLLGMPCHGLPQGDRTGDPPDAHG